MNRRKPLWVTALLLLLGLALVAMYLFPIYVLVVNSFKRLKDIYLNVLAPPLGEVFTIQNYPDAFARMNYPSAFLNSTVITVCATALILLFCSMAAWVLVRYKTRTSTAIFLAYASAMLIPFHCVMLPLVRQMGILGLMNRPGLVFMYVGFGASMAVMLLHGFIKNIPMELEDAAAIDGCGMLRTFFIIVFPLLKTILVTVAILNVMGNWNDFLLPSLMINKDGWQTLPLRTYLFFGQFVKRWDVATAGLVLCMVPIIIFYLWCQKYIVQGVVQGAVKG